MILRNEGGQITVFLSLAFLVFLSLSFVVLEGIHAYMESSLAEEAATEAGNEILANYDRYLFEKYHVFFMDPRERGSVKADAESFLNSYISSGFYGFQCQGVTVKEEKMAVDEEGLFLRYQINEYMKYRNLTLAAEGLSRLAKSHVDKNSEEADFNVSEGSDPSGGGKEGEGGEKGDKEPSPEMVEKRVTWVDFKKQLDMVVHSGVLVFAAEHPESLSSSSISSSDLPSGGLSDKGGSSLPQFSWHSLSEWRSFLHSDNSGGTEGIDVAGSVNMMTYLFDCYSYYGKEDSEGGGGNHDHDQGALTYELEYLLAGHSADIENLKAVTNRILLMRFLVNYQHASSDPELQSEIGLMAAALAGVLQFPGAEPAVRVLLTAAISYAESLLELRSLLHGKRVALIKNSSNWNLSFSNAPKLLAGKGAVTEVSQGVSYKDYLMLFLAMRIKSRTLIYRMMDIMQVNTRLHEPGFLMKDCIFSLTWNIKLSCSRWFFSFPGVNKATDAHFTMDLERFVSY